MNDKANKEVILIKSISEGNEKAFLEIFNLYFKNVCRFVEKYVHSKELSEDLVQEVFIKTWENRDKLTEVKSFKSYLYTCAKNHTLNSLKKVARSKEAMGEIVNAYSSTRNLTEENILDKEYISCFNKILDNLPERSREIFKLCREEKKSYEEVANIMGISKNAVKNHMVFSMKQLRHSVETELGISLTVLIGVIFK